MFEWERERNLITFSCTGIVSSAKYVALYSDRIISVPIAITDVLLTITNVQYCSLIDKFNRFRELTGLFFFCANTTKVRGCNTYNIIYTYVSSVKVKHDNYVHSLYRVKSNTRAFMNSWLRWRWNWFLLFQWLLFA